MSRTFVRLIMWLWDEKAKSTLFQVYVTALSTYIVRKFIYKGDTMTFEIGKDFDEVSNLGTNESKEKVEDAIHYTSRIIYWISLTVIIGTPLYVISILFGYWVLVSYISMIGCVSAATAIICTNFYAKWVKSYAVLSTVFNDDTILTCYVASTGYDQGDTVIKVFARQGAYTGFWTIIGVFLFSSYQIPWVIRRLNALCEDTYTMIKHRRYYNGKKVWPACAVLLVRLLLYGIGLSSLIYFDTNYSSMRKFSGQAFSNQPVIVMLMFLICFLVKEVLFFIPVFKKSFFGNHIARKWLVLFFSLAEISFAVATRCLVGGYASTLAVLIAYLDFDFRRNTDLKIDPRIRWDWPCTVETQGQIRRKDRTFRNEITIFRVLIITGITSFALSFLVKQSKFSFGSQDTSSQQLYSQFDIPPLCGLQVSNLSLVEYGAFANCAYHTNASEIREIISNYSAIANFEFIESTSPTLYQVFNAPSPSTLSVIAVRGTYSLDDVFQDLYMYSTSSLLSASSYLGTFVQQWPVEIVAILSYAISKIGQTGSTLADWEIIGAQVEVLFAKNRTVVVTGHSLGGAISGIVAAHYGITGVGFSAPGLGYQTLTYNFTL
ncbi:hypothetical protein HK103_001651 [Boothiomyces macroporosus]|uniref:Fungal lipase-type domain-containing protein n=1 Tax=Boothiomyces macroporosus TaxID=261099 RepID=A0AAD5Y2Y0_9FUNG|nr:hypothetical protein HK103_001651 [Boothiomyces macroporosus]